MRLSATGRAAVLAAGLLLGLVGSPPPLPGSVQAAEPATTSKQPAKPPLFALRVVYLGKRYPEPPPLSLVEPILDDKGLQGARLAQQENQLTGRLMRQDYQLVEQILPEDGDVVAAARSLLAAGERYIVADLNAPDLLAIADLPEAQAALIMNVRANDDELRNEQCRVNVYHVAPSDAMRADGLAQYLAWKRWNSWFLVRGEQPEDLRYAAALRRAAGRFGGKIVEERAYQFEAGARRVESGHQQIQTQMPLLTQAAPDYDVLVVADAGERFGEYLMFRTEQPKLVVGTHGLVSAAWHRAYEQFGSMSLHSAFEKLADRQITEADYLAWLGVKIFAEAALRTSKADLDTIRKYLTSDAFVAPGFKGVGLTFRRWDHQLRQPMLIAWRGSLVSMSPQDAFLHEHFATDTLGYDQPESGCRFGG